MIYNGTLCTPRLLLAKSSEAIIMFRTAKHARNNGNKPDIN